MRSERSLKSEGGSEGKGEGKRDDPHADKRPVHRALRPKSEGVRVKVRNYAKGSKVLGAVGFESLLRRRLFFMKGLKINYVNKMLAAGS